jgi:hypothetical protein
MLTYRVCPLKLSPATGWRRLLAQALGTVLPKNDPDFFLENEAVSYWWLELEGLETRREIGFDSAGAVLRFAPVGDNWGVFVGEELAPSHLGEALSGEQFEEAWSRAVQT